MMINNEQQFDNSKYKSFVGVRFANAPRAYFFGVEDETKLPIGIKVVVETMRGLELGEVAFDNIPIDKYESNLGLKPIIRIANDVDIRIYESNKKEAVSALEIGKNEAGKLHLEMNFISCEFTLDRTKIIYSYVADERVDFRELLKALASKLHTRIELRQIGSRDKAKLVGGIGICGLPLCCSTFLNEFDGISINRAKNQMLAINIPKLSGHCGKLICCLKYEDDAYTEAKKLYPDVGTKVWIDKNEYSVIGIDIIARTVKMKYEDNFVIMPLEDFKKQTNWKKRNNNEAK